MGSRRLIMNMCRILSHLYLLHEGNLTYKVKNEDIQLYPIIVTSIDLKTHNQGSEGCIEGRITMCCQISRDRTFSLSMTASHNQIIKDYMLGPLGIILCLTLRGLFALNSSY